MVHGKIQRGKGEEDLKNGICRTSKIKTEALCILHATEVPMPNVTLDRHYTHGMLRYCCRITLGTKRNQEATVVDIDTVASRCDLHICI
jgi:hypothetical protein